MMLSWLLSPLAVHTVVAVSMCLCIYLFVSSKEELRAEQKAWGASRAAFENQLRRMQEELDALRFTMQAPVAIAQPVVMETAVVEPRPAPVAPMEERTRTEALALSKAGFPMERIAPVLQVPENEVELLLKIQRLTA